MAMTASQFQYFKGAEEARCRVALVGFGTVGKSVARLLQQNADPALELTHVCNRNVARKQARWMTPEVVWTESFDHVLNSDADVVLELIGGIDAAYQLVRGAIESRKSVVTANKQLMARFGPELLKLAASKNVYLGFGACVAGGVPILSALQDGLAADRLLKIRGILNGTCNYILTRMEAAGVSFADALAEAQQAGFAEADPTEDVDGLDAAVKLAILCRSAFKVDASVRQLNPGSIRRITAVDFAYAHELGCSIRQLAVAEMRGDAQLYLSVGPALVPNTSPLAMVSGCQNLVVTTGEFGGDTSFAGNGAGGDPTAVAVVSDLLQAARYRLHPQGSSHSGPWKPCKIIDDAAVCHYVRFVVRDRPGILAEVTRALSRHQINVDAVLQKPNYSKAALPFVITLEPCRRDELERALAEISGCDFMVEAPFVMPIGG